MQSSGLASLSELIASLGANAKEPPPVHLWNPQRCGDIGMAIKADGAWLHEGRPILRESLVRLFASILRKDPDGFWLVTPVEKVSVAVEDAPFLAVRADRLGEGTAQQIVFITNVGDAAPLNDAHPLRIATAPAGEPRPYVRIRGGLDALLTRSTYYELANWAQPAETGEGIGVWSGGSWWRLD